MTPSSKSNGRLLVLIPAYNEETKIGAVIDGVRTAVPECDVLVVDDCSRDATNRAAREAGARVVRHPVNLGYGSALLTGYQYADIHGYERVVQMDGDGQHDAASIPDLLAGLDGGYDLALGSRFGAGVRTYRPQRLRAIGMRLFGWIASRALGREITDPTSGFQALSGRLVRFHASGDHFPPDYPDADILILVGRAGYRVTEVPVTMYEKPGGASIHSGLKPVYYVVKMILSILLVLTGAPKRLPEEVPCP
jgi:glycosyltransferase involved in cell wall biosynthesis